ncbi:MAG: RNA polymerase sigma factor [Sphingomonadales bacterium]
MQNDALRAEIVKVLTPLRRFAYALTGARHDADDLLQATVERVLERGMPEEADVQKWSFRVCRNIWIDQVRAQKVRAPISDESAIDRADSHDGERAVFAKITFDQVNGAMGALPADQRAALGLVALEGMTYAEAATILDTPIGTVMSRISRARQALAKALAEPVNPQFRHSERSQA